MTGSVLIQLMAKHGCMIKTLFYKTTGKVCQACPRIYIIFFVTENAESMEVYQ